MDLSSSAGGSDSDSDASSVFDSISLSSSSDGTTESTSDSNCSDDFGGEGLLPEPPPPARGPPRRTRPRRSPLAPPRLPLRWYGGALSTIDEEGPPARGAIDPAAHGRSASPTRPVGEEWREVDLWGGSGSEGTRSFALGGTDAGPGVGDTISNLVVDFINEDSDENLIVEFPHKRSGDAVCSESVCSIADESEGAADCNDHDKEDTVIPRADCDSRGWCVRHPHVRLRRRTRLLGNKWEDLMTACPDCCMEELLRRYAKSGIGNDADDESGPEDKAGFGTGKCDHSVVTKDTHQTTGSYGTSATEKSNESSVAQERGGPVRVSELPRGRENEDPPGTNARSRSALLKLNLCAPMNGIRLLKLPSSHQGCPGGLREPLEDNRTQPKIHCTSLAKSDQAACIFRCPSWLPRVGISLRRRAQ